MCQCMNVYLSVHLFVYIYVWMHISLYVHMYICMYLRSAEKKYKTGTNMDVCMYV